MPDILLLQPPIRDFYITRKRTIPYGLTCIAATLRKDGFTVDIFDGLATDRSRIIPLPDEMSFLRTYYRKPDISPFSLFHHFRHFGYSFEHMEKMVKESGAFLVGISSLFTAYHTEAVKSAEIVKKVLPECCVVLGGHHPTAMPEKIMENKSIDYILRGEGEETMPILAKQLKTGGNIDIVPGIVFRKKDGSIHISKPAVVNDLNRCYTPASDLIKHSFYRRNKKKSIVIVSSRGCPLNCSYCSLGSSTLQYRKRSVESVLLEIEQASKKHDIGFIDFEDENPALDREIFMTLIQKISLMFNNHKPELRAMNGLFPPSIDDEMVKVMKQAGFKTLNLSLGTTSKGQQKQFNRPDVIDSFENALVSAEKYDLTSVSYIIVGAPGQKPETSINDLLYLAGKRTLAGVSVFYPSPGSTDNHLCADLGILPDHLTLMRSSALPISQTTSRTESITLLRLGRIVNFIKSLADREIPIPTPLPFNQVENIDSDNKEITGLKLLQWFLHDGKIRGITPDNEIYEHRISEKLTGIFLEGMKKISVRGIISFK